VIEYFQFRLETEIEINPTSTVIGTFWSMESANPLKLLMASLAGGPNT
jgi:hypothetical protein